MSELETTKIKRNARTMYNESRDTHMIKRQDNAIELMRVSRFVNEWKLI